LASTSSRRRRDRGKRSPVTTEITKLNVTGAGEGEIIWRVARRFPELTPAELWAALQDAAERQASKRH
jgi:hypothetical protein